MRDDSGTRDHRFRRNLTRSFKFSLELVLVILVVIAVAFTGILLLDGPTGVEERVADLTGNEDLAADIGDAISEAIPATGAEDNESDPPEEGAPGGEAAPPQADGFLDDPPGGEDGDFSPQRIERLIAESINEIRTAAGLDELTHRTDVSAVARSHGEDMAEREYFAHRNPEGETPQDRMDAAAVECSVGENIAQLWFEPALPPGYTAQGPDSEADIAEAMVDGWMNSSGHRENILESGYTTHGIGVTISDDGAVFGTHNFCASPP